ncbi:MAG: outer membrane beta-barrel protein [Candidatus Eisenbacteria bacterium]|nr:outer membrane beta-barrel protein [Candidatus Eisenbacteria bacterium]
MKQTSRAGLAMSVPAMAVVAVLVLASIAGAQQASTKWRSSRYGRTGAELWGEFPLVTVPVGDGYEDDYDVRSGLGFGFGIMFGFSDKLGLEGRMVQTEHKSGDGRMWDMDQYYAGFRYMFRYEEQVQPYVALGGARLALEWTAEEGGVTDFERIWGYGAYASVGTDYVMSRTWVAGLRVNYTWMKYSRENIGTEENDIEKSLDGSSLGFSLSLHYRIPLAW